MSTTTAQPTRTVTIQLDDPFSSMFQPSYQAEPPKPRKAAAFANSEINSSHQAQTFMPSTVQPVFSDPLLKPHSTLNTEFVPKAEYIKAKRSARDGWIAVMVLGSVIAVGTYWLVDRVNSDAGQLDALGSQITNLNGQLASERGVVISRNKEIQLLNDQLNDEQTRAAKLLKKK